MKTQFQNSPATSLPPGSLLEENSIGDQSNAGRRRLLSIPGEPLFIADWIQVLMIHYEVDAPALQAAVPFALDLRDGRAFVSLVAFTIRGMRPRFGGRLTAALLKPISTHHFLNVRTYVRHQDEPGIYFMREWLSNRLSVALGPHAFGLPYRFAKIRYLREQPGHFIGALLGDRQGKRFAFRGKWNPAEGFVPCEPGSLSEWLMERYTAYTSRRGKRRFFRVWHQPWLKANADVEVEDQSLLENDWQFFGDATLVGAHYSPGAFDAWMGWPHRVTRLQKESAAPEFIAAR